MTKLRIKECDKAEMAKWLEGYKQYASVPDDSRDALLTGLVRSAVLKVQEYADLALVSSTIELVCKTGRRGSISLYQGGGTVSSVKDAEGNDVAYTQISDSKLSTSLGNTEVTVTYVTSPLAGSRIALRPTVWRYATALYDGEDTEKLSAILNEALC